MTTNITDTAHSTASKTYPQNYEQLQVKVYCKTLSQQTILEMVAVNAEGVFVISQKLISEKNKQNRSWPQH